MQGSSRQRMIDAFAYTNPDRIPVVYHPSTAGLHVHGQKLLDLFNEFPPDNPIAFGGLPKPSPESFDTDGHYHEFKKDAWGVEWEYLIFGIQGHPRNYPFTSWEAAADYELPAIPAVDKDATDKLRRNYLVCGGGVSIFEKLCALRPMDETLVGLLTEESALLAFLDRLVAYGEAVIGENLSAGVDVITFGDDWGTQAAPVISPDLFRALFKPRYQRLFAPIHKAGKRVFLHSCGRLGPILDEFLELGIDGLWPQLPLYENEPSFFDRCKERGVALYLHPDRQRLIPLGSPKEIEERIRGYAERHHRIGGGGIFYIEIENDAPFENVEALIRSAHKYR